MIDESRSNGIDDDGDWDPEKDDVGVDGVPNTGDFGEAMVYLQLETSLILDNQESLTLNGQI